MSPCRTAAYAIKFLVTIVVISRLTYRKGIDLLVATAPHICALFPNVKFIIGVLIPFVLPIDVLICAAGGDGPKLIDLLQMREKHMLQDRIEMLGSVRHSDVHNVSRRTARARELALTALRSSCAGRSS